MFIDKNLSEVVSREEMAEYVRFRYDLYKVLHPLWACFVFGGYSIFFVVPLWLGNYTWMPSNIGSKDQSVMQKWREVQDMNRYKHAPALITDYRWWYEWFLSVPQDHSTAWEAITEKNDVHRDPVLCRKIADLYDEIVPFHRIRRKQVRLILRAMGAASFPMFGKLCAQARIRDYWELILTEDHMIMKNKLLSRMDKDEIFDYAWRRYLVPCDKQLSEEQVLQRVEDYHVFLGGNSYVETAHFPNLFTLFAYVFGYYNDPAFLEADASELDANDFDHLKWWGRDQFLRRLEFENGPFRDEAEKHGQEKLAERQKKLLK